MSSPDKFEQVLKRYWGYDAFRGIQRPIIESIAAGNDTLGLMPTGGGKSITFQVPALTMQGTCIVISPLIALMNDQVVNLRKRHVKAAAIHSGMMRHRIIDTLDNCVFGAVRILYVSPERLTSDIFLTKLSHINVSFFAVDEAHCITQWGYDFRPAYLKIVEIRKLKPLAPILALTATATEDVVEDIQDKLGFKKRNVFKMSFARGNLSYIVRKTENKPEVILHTLKNNEGSAIIYTRTRKFAKELALWLRDKGIEANFFHAGLDTTERDTRQSAWTNDKTRVIVTTNAFGMGIDKPDVRMVIHADCPETIEAYFQEAGRAGRDGNKAAAIMLYNSKDISSLRRHLSAHFPDKAMVKTIYEHIASFFQIGEGSGCGAIFDFDMEKFCKNFHHYPTTVIAALKILSLSGYIEYSIDNDKSSMIQFLLTRESLYKLQQNSEAEEKVIEGILRIYTGTFVDLTPIDEGSIARQCGLEKPVVTGTLISLGRKHILKYVPSHNIPYIYYTQQRVDTDKIVITPDAYDIRKRKFTARENAMERYLISNDTCRSQLLLAYFGERDSKPCGVCDVCDAKTNRIDNDIRRAMSLIASLLSDGKSHTRNEIIAACESLDIETTAHAIQQMVDQEKAIPTENGWKKKRD